MVAFPRSVSPLAVSVAEKVADVPITAAKVPARALSAPIIPSILVPTLNSEGFKSDLVMELVKMVRVYAVEIIVML